MHKISRVRLLFVIFNIKTIVKQISIYEGIDLHKNLQSSDDS